MELTDQIQWVHMIQKMGIRHTIQSNGILVNLNQVQETDLQVLYHALPKK